MTALPQDVVADLSRLVAELEQRLDSSFVVYDQAIARQAALADENARLQSGNARLVTEAQEALERQTATADILQVIARSPSNVQPIFDAIVKSAARLFGPCGATITTLKDGKLYWNATATTLPGFDFERAKSVYPIPFDPDRAPSARAILERRIIEIPDTAAPDTPDLTRQAAAAGGFSSITFVPLVNRDQGIGTIILNHPEAGFRLSENQLALVQTFADQAVIAIENARLFNETQEALERQTATADILKVIAGSPSDVQPVFDAIATSANRLLGGFSTTVFRFIDGVMHLKAFTPTSPAGDELLQAMYPRPLAEFPTFELVRGGATAQFADTEAAGVPLAMRDLARSRGFRSMLFTPLISNGLTIGMIGITRPEPGGFADHHVQLLQTFADQAVIAIENVRLFDEVQARTRDLSESLEQQTATSEVLQVISSTPGELEPVFQSMLENATRVCGAHFGAMFLYEQDRYEVVAAHNSPLSFGPTRERLIRPHPESALGVVSRTKQTTHISDLRTNPAYLQGDAAVVAMAEVAGARTLVVVPMLKEDQLIGAIRDLPAGSPAIQRQADCAAWQFRRPGRDRNREYPAC